MEETKEISLAPHCPICGTKLQRDGKIYIKDYGADQRWYCKTCDQRIPESILTGKNLNIKKYILFLLRFYLHHINFF